MKKIIREGQEIPRYYGVAYRSWDMYNAVCYPIPLNILVALWNKAMIWFKWRHGLYKNGYSKGYDIGYAEGRKYAFHQYKKQVISEEVETIVKNLLSHQDNVFKVLLRERDDEKVQGWIVKFIESEKKRIESEV